jgi:hypothetical protein
MLTCSDEQYLPAIDRMCNVIQGMKSIEALLRFPSSSTMQRMLQTSLIQLLTHADAAAADWQQLQASAVHSHINSSSALQLITGVPSAVLLLLDPMQQQALLGMLATLMQRGLLQHLAPLISTCATPHVVTVMVAQLESFIMMLDKGSSCGDLLLTLLVEQALGHVQWLLAYGEAGAGHYVRLCWQLLTATSPADLRNQAQAVCQESHQMQQQEAAAAAAGDSAGCSQSASSAYCASSADASAAAAAALAEEMADAVPQPDTPGLYGSRSGGVFGCEQDKAWPGCSGSSMPAAESAFGGGQCSLYSEQPDLTFSSSSSSNAAAFGWSNQYDSSSNTWEQMQGRSLYGVAAGDNASPGVFGSSSSSSSSSITAVAAFAGDESVPDTFNNSSSSLAYSSSQAARLSWGSQDNSGSTEQPSSSSNSWQQYQGPLFGDAADDSGTPAAGMSQYESFNVYESSSTTAAAVGDVAEQNASSMLPASTAADSTVTTSSITTSSSSSAEVVAADSSMAAASLAAVAVEAVEISSGGSSSSARSGRPGRAKVLRCLAVCAVVSVRFLKCRGACCSAAS